MNEGNRPDNSETFMRAEIDTEKAALGVMRNQKVKAIERKMLHMICKILHLSCLWLRKPTASPEKPDQSSYGAEQRSQRKRIAHRAV